MDPYSMMMGYGLINSVSQLIIRPLADKFTSGTRREEMMMQMEEKQKLDLESVRLNKEIELSNNQRLQEYSHQCRLAEARTQFENQLQMWAMGQFNSSMWPLLTPFDHPSLKPDYAPGQQVPVNVFLAKTDPRSPYALLIQSDVKNRLGNFVTTAYSGSQTHPVICRIGDWKDGFQDAAFINALWYGMQGRPSIVINPIQSEFGELLDLNISMWGLASTGYAPMTQTVLSGTFGSSIGRIKREETRRWIESGLPLSSAEMQHNATLLKQEQALIEAGRGALTDCLLSQYSLPKEIQTAVITKFSRQYSHIVSCVAGMYADIYHLLEYGATPYMPQAISEYNMRTGSDFLIPKVAAAHYRKALTNLVCTDYLQDRLPDTYLNVASSLSYDPVSAGEILCEGVGLWANRKLDREEIQLPESIEGCVRLLRDRAGDSDRQYLQSVAKVLVRLNQTDAAGELKRRIVSMPEVTSEKAPTDESKADAETSGAEWEVMQVPTYTINDFSDWVQQNGSNALRHGAKEAVAYMTESRNILLAFMSSNGTVIPVDGIGGRCIVTDRFLAHMSIVDRGIIEYDLTINKYTSNSTKFMQKKEFDAFERMGKQLDRLVNNLKRSARPTRGTISPQPASERDFARELTDFFINDNSRSMESENCDTATIAGIRTWIESKLPVAGATKAHIFRTNCSTDSMLLCLFFSNIDEALLGDRFPKKRILCSNIDIELDSLLNGGNLATIKL